MRVWSGYGGVAVVVLSWLLPGCRLEERRTEALGQVFSAGPRPGALVVSDFDGDGAPDVAVLTRGASELEDGGLELLLNDGLGRLSVPTRLISVPEPASLHLFDENADGQPDLSFSFGQSPLQARTLLLPSRGDGTFEPPEPLATGLLSSVTAGDLDGDGLPDLAITGQYFAPTPRYDATGVYLRREDGAHVRTPDVGQLGSPLAIDWNLDGTLDLIDASGADLVQLRANDEGRFEVAHRIPVGTSLERLTSLDVDDDGLQDVIGLTGDRKTLLTFRAQDDYALGNPVATVLDAPVRLGGVIAHEGKLGVYLVEPQGRRIVLLEALGDGRLVPWRQLATGSAAFDVASADLDGDGEVELVVAEEDSGRIRVLPIGS